MQPSPVQSSQSGGYQREGKVGGRLARGISFRWAVLFGLVMKLQEALKAGASQCASSMDCSDIIDKATHGAEGYPQKCRRYTSFLQYLTCHSNVNPTKNVNLLIKLYVPTTHEKKDQDTR